MLGNFLIAERMAASQDGLSSMELVKMFLSYNTGHITEKVSVVVTSYCHSGSVRCSNLVQVTSYPD
jgi:hypothetical protein